MFILLGLDPLVSLPVHSLDSSSRFLDANSLWFFDFASFLTQITIFAASFVVATVFFYIFSPLVFKTTSFCCGSSGTEAGHVIVSCIVGNIACFSAHIWRFRWNCGL
jgi:hypothetical protein